MVALTWRTVDAPDFRGVMEGYRGFGETISNALSRLQGGIEKFDDNKTDAVNKLVQAQILQYQNPDEYKTALQSGALINALGSNASRLDGQTIQAMGNRVNTLLDQQYKGLQAEDLRGDVAFEGYTRDRTKGENTNLDALKPYAFRIAAGDPTLAKDEGYLKAMQGVAAEKQFSLMTGGQGVRKGELDIFGAGLDNTTKSYNNMMTQRNDEEAQAIKKIGSDLMSLGTDDDRMAYLQTVDPKYRGGAYMYFRGMGMDNGGSSSTGGVSGGGTSGGTGTGAAFDMVIGNGAYGSPSKPLSSMTLGEAIDFGTKVLIPNTRSKGVGRAANGEVLGSSAMGAYQITQSTLKAYAPKVLGANWQQMQFTPEVQDRIARQIFEDNKNGNLKRTWEGLPDTRPGAYANKSWDEMRHIIAKVESAPFVWKPNGTALAANNITTALQAGTSGNVNGELFQSFQKLSGDTSSDAAIATRYTSDGAFKGMDRGDVLTKIREVRQKFGVNAAVAADILERSTTQQGVIGRNSSWFTGNKSGLTFDDDEINRYGNMFRDGAKGLRNAGTTLGVAQQANAAVQTNVALVSKLTADIQALQRRGQRSPSLEAQLAQAQSKLAGTVAGTAEVGAALGNRNNPPARQQAPARQVPSFVPPARAATPSREVEQARARDAAIRANRAPRPYEPGYAAYQARNAPKPAPARTVAQQKNDDLGARLAEDNRRANERRVQEAAARQRSQQQASAKAEEQRTLRFEMSNLETLVKRGVANQRQIQRLAAIRQQLSR